MQQCLAAFFQGRKVVVPPPPPKRPVGRPKLPRPEGQQDEETAAELRVLRKRSKEELMQEILEARKRPRGSQESLEESMPLPDGALEPEVSEELVPLQDGPSEEGATLVPMSREACGMLGKEYGVLGKEFGKLGGRPKLNQEMSVVPMSYRTKGKVVKGTRDDSFGPQAKLRLCDLYDKMLETSSQDEVLRQLVRHTGRTKVCTRQ